VSVTNKGSIIGTLRVMAQEDKAWDLITASVGSSNPPVGLSVTGIAKAEEGEAEGKKGMVVEKIVAANSCDMVAYPAAGGKLDQIAASKEMDELLEGLVDNITKEEIESQRPDLIKAWKNEWKTPKKGETMGVDAEKMQEMLDAQAEGFATAVDEATKPIKEAIITVTERMELIEAREGVAELGKLAYAALAEAGIPERLREGKVELMLMTVESISEDTPEKTLEAINARFAKFAEAEKAAYVAAGAKLEEDGDDGRGSPEGAEGEELSEAGEAVREKLGVEPARFGETAEEYAKRIAEAKE